MPDAHIGVGTCIGIHGRVDKDKATSRLYYCGVDIGCGNGGCQELPGPRTLLTDTPRLLMKKIEERIPMGVGKKVETPIDSDHAVRGAILGYPRRAGSSLWHLRCVRV